MEWRVHAGESDPPIRGTASVEVMFRDGETAQGKMHDWDQNWQWVDLDEYREGDIVAYRLLPTPAQGKD